MRSPSSSSAACIYNVSACRENGTRFLYILLKILIDRTAKKRYTDNRKRKSGVTVLKYDVVVIGGGVTGCSIAR